MLKTLHGLDGEKREHERNRNEFALNYVNLIESPLWGARWHLFLKILLCVNMGCHWTFYDYVDTKGKNLINLWLNDEAKRAKAQFNSTIHMLESIPYGTWRRPWVDTLKGKCKGLFEVRLQGLEFRILAFHGPGQSCSTLAIGLVKKSNKVRIEDCLKALDIKDLVDSRPSERRVVHDFGGEKDEIPA